MLKSGVVLFLYPMENQGEIILYQPDNEVKLEVRLEEETVWLTQAQMAELFQTSKQNVSLHTELSPDFSCQGILDNCRRPYPLRTAISAADRQLRGRFGAADAQQAECRRASGLQKNRQVRHACYVGLTNTWQI